MKPVSGLDIADFAARMVADQAYRTPGGPLAGRPPAGRFLASARYHAIVAAAVLVASVRARRGRFDRDAWTQCSLTILRGVEAVGGRFEVTGLSHIAGLRAPAVVAANHMSAIETLVLGCLLLPFGGLTFVVKRGLWNGLVMGPVMRALRAIPVGRGNPREDLRAVIDMGVERLREGLSVVVFPQGRRDEEFDPASFNTLATKLAARAGVPLVPLALKTDFLASGRWLRGLGRVYPDRTIHFEFGEPVAPGGRGREGHERVVAFVLDRLRAWGARIRAAPPVPESGEHGKLVG